jgi:U3 small nucleolar RNA-associated protein 4
MSFKTSDFVKRAGSETHLDQKVNAMPIKPESRAKKKIKSWMNSSQFKLDRMAIPMLISAGNDAKLFTYPANAFIAFQPHDVCHAPQRTPISLAVKQHDGHIMIAQHEHEVEVWRIIVNRPNSTNAEQNKSSWSNCNGKRKSQELPHHNGRQKIANGHSKDISRGPGNGHSINKSTNSGYSKCFGKEKGSSPELLARIKCKSAENITCSALSGCGKLVAFSDNSRSRVFELEQQNTGPPETKMWGVTKRMLPANIPPAQCMVFCGFSQLILACSDQAIWVN